MYKGGESRKWYGNHIAVVNWADDGCEIKKKKVLLYGIPSIISKVG